MRLGSAAKSSLDSGAIDHRRSSRMAHRDIIVIGASAGGVDALTRLAAGLPRDLAAAVLVVTHMPAGSPSRLAEQLDAAGPLRAARAVDGEAHSRKPVLRGGAGSPSHHRGLSDPSLARTAGESCPTIGGCTVPVCGDQSRTEGRWSRVDGYAR